MDFKINYEKICDLMRQITIEMNWPIVSKTCPKIILYEKLNTCSLHSDWQTTFFLPSSHWMTPSLFWGETSKQKTSQKYNNAPNHEVHLVMEIKILEFPGEVM